jgi:hypothetical protein
MRASAAHKRWRRSALVGENMGMANPDIDVRQAWSPIWRRKDTNFLSYA